MEAADDTCKPQGYLAGRNLERLSCPSLLHDEATPHSYVFTFTTFPQENCGLAFLYTSRVWGTDQFGNDGVDRRRQEVGCFLKGLTVPHLCRFEKWTLGMNRTGWVSRSVSGLRNVISFPLKPESKQPFRPTDGKSSSSQFAWQFKRQLHTERGKCLPTVSQQKYQCKDRTAEPGLVLCCVLEGLPAQTPTQSREVGY